MLDSRISSYISYESISQLLPSVNTCAVFSLVSKEWLLLPKPILISRLLDSSRFKLISLAPKLSIPFLIDAVGAFWISLRLLKNVQFVSDAIKPLPTAMRFFSLTIYSECIATVIPLVSRTINTRWDFPSRICVQESRLMRGYLNISLIDVILIDSCS